MPRKAIDVGDCVVDGCCRKATNKSLRLCQMHYFRKLRYGTTDTVRRGKRKERVVTPNGYVRVSSDDHPLAQHGYVYEHRKVAYDERAGIADACEMCGNPVTWKTCHVDHIDDDRENNDPKNLRVTCRSCNTRRNLRPQHEYANCWSITYGGVTQTAKEWSSHPDVHVAQSTIIRRKKKGSSDKDALFAPKITHNGKGVKRKRESLNSGETVRREG